MSSLPVLVGFMFLYLSFYCVVVCGTLCGFFFLFIPSIVCASLLYLEGIAKLFFTNECGWFFCSNLLIYMLTHISSPWRTTKLHSAKHGVYCTLLVSTCWIIYFSVKHFQLFRTGYNAILGLSQQLFTYTSYSLLISVNIC